MHQQSVILHRYGYNHTIVKSCILNRSSSLVLINQLIRSARCTLYMHNFGNIVVQHFIFLQFVCTKLASNRPLHTLQRWENVLNTAKATIPGFGMNGFVYHHSLYMVLYIIVYMDPYTITRCTWFCIPFYTWFCIPTLVMHGFVYHCIHGFGYHHSLCMVVYTVVYMVLYTVTRYTWFCIPVYKWYCIPSSSL